MTVQPFPRCGRRQLQDSGSSPDVVHIQTYSKVEEGASFVNAEIVLGVLVPMLVMLAYFFIMCRRCYTTSPTGTSPARGRGHGQRHGHSGAPTSWRQATAVLVSLHGPQLPMTTVEVVIVEQPDTSRMFAIACFKDLRSSMGSSTDDSMSSKAAPSEPTAPGDGKPLESRGCPDHQPPST